MPLLAQIGLAWLAGIALAPWLSLPWQAILALSLPGIAALLLYRDQPRAKIVALWLLALSAGAFCFTFFQPVFDDRHIAFYNDGPEPVTVTGVVTDEPDIRDYYTNLRLQAETLQQGDVRRPVTGLVLVRTARYPIYRYGDRLAVTGRLETPPVFDSFSYKDYLARFGIHTMLRRAAIEQTGAGQGHPFWATMYTFKERAAATINQILPEPQASLLNGILLGIETGIPRKLYENFNLTGTSHIIVISGSNIVIIAALALFLTRRTLGARYAPLVAVGAIVLYTLLVGADAAVMRAAFMGGMWMLALAVGRPGLALNALFFSGIVLTALNPLIFWDVGFQLSFLATLGLIVLVPPLEQAASSLLNQRLKMPHGQLAIFLLSELVIITLAAQIITGPLLVYHFGRLSLVSLLSNMLILPAQPPIMVVGGLATLAGMVWLPMGQVIGWLAWLPLAWSVWVVEQTARLPLASLNLGQIPLWLLGLFYAVIAAGVWWLKQPRLVGGQSLRGRFPELGTLTTRLWLGGAGLVLLLTGLAVWSLPDGRLHVAFLDVGHGDSILVTLPDGRQLLIDGGPSPTTLNWRLGQTMPFWDRTIDLVINTHPDSDHLGGLVSLPDRFTIKQLLISNTEADTELYRQWQTEVEETGLEPVIGQAGTRLVLAPDLLATVLAPLPESSGNDKPNNRSVVLHLQYGQIGFLFPGDIEAITERQLVRSGLPPATVLKSPHHGSNTSSTDAFLRASGARIVVISAGQDNSFGHPSPEVLARYATHGLTVLRTDEQGTVELITDGKKLWAKTIH
jgi:competence protein ComEC